MRLLALAIFAIGTVSIGPAAAQRFDPAYPVCLHEYGRGANYYECAYTTLPQCNVSASGRYALCEINSTASPRLLKNECIGRRVA